jgi:hypothetical protein
MAALKYGEFRTIRPFRCTILTIGEYSLLLFSVPDDAKSNSCRSGELSFTEKRRIVDVIVNPAVIARRICYCIRKQSF